MKRLVILSTMLFIALATSAQSDMQQLQAWLNGVAGFDNEYPREKVVLHTDQQAYMEGETMWIKAFVVRASTLTPQPVSRVLYVELLNAGGQMMDQKLIHLDSLGQGDGMFDFNLPVTSGFYEVRAYTREMRNWGDAACFSRVLPVFEKPKVAGDFADLTIKRPEVEHDLVNHHERPWVFGRKATRHVLFFPEGGHRVGSLPQRIAYLVTDGRDTPCTDTLRLYDAAGREVLTSVPEHLGMGAFTLPDGFADGEVRIGSRKFPLPTAVPECCTLQMLTESDSLCFLLRQRAEEPRPVAVALLCREKQVWCDTLTLGAGTSVVALPRRVAGHGVNRFVVFDAYGQTLAERQFYHRGQPLRKARVAVRQSAEYYDPFRPIALDISVADATGKPLSTDIALSVRDAEGDLVFDGAARMEAQWLLASEVKGYVHRPEWYFENPADSVREHALDLLLLVQGWTAQPVSVMAGAEPFDLKQPIEDKLILRGKVIKDKDKLEPYPNMQLNLTLISPAGQTMTGKAVTDEKGAFEFTSNEDYVGDLMGIFSIKDVEENKQKWARVMLDRWYGPVPRPYSPLEMELKPDLTLDTKPPLRGLGVSPNDLFVWTDTLNNIRSFLLNEAVVKGKNPHRYKGLNFSRYTYEGGEKTGYRHMDQTWNVAIELERAKDKGLDFFNMQDFFNYMLNNDPLAYDNSHFVTTTPTDDGKSVGQQMSESRPSGTDASEGHHESHDYDNLEWDEQQRYVSYRGHGVVLRVNNGTGAVGGDAEGGGIDAQPEEVKSCMFSTRYILWPPYEPGTWFLFVYTREDWHMWRQKKGFTKRHIWGFAEPVAFPRLNYYELPKDNPDDYRRTLYWSPSLHTDDTGRASAVFFSNARGNQQLSISISGMTADGEIISYER